MKNLKRISALVLAVLMATVLGASALASGLYNPSEYQTLNLTDTIDVDHTLELTELPMVYDVTYTFTVNPQAQIMQPSDIPAANVGMVISGAPTMTGTITYTSADFNYTAGNPNNQTIAVKPLAINFAGVSVQEPGLYRWEVTKTKSYNGPAEPTNNVETSYIYVLVVDNGGTLQSGVVGFAEWGTTAPSEKFTEVNPGFDPDDPTSDRPWDDDQSGTSYNPIQDQWPWNNYDLEVTKTVTGNQGSKDQYFPFTITINTPANTGAMSVVASGTYDAATPVTPYDATAHTNPASPVSISASGTATVINVWLKDGQSFKLEGLPAGTSYEVVEGETAAADYVTTIAVTGDGHEGQFTPPASDPTATMPTSRTVSGKTVADTYLEADTTVAYTNDKTVTPPTGISLEYLAPIAGIVMVVALGAVMMATRRKEQEEA